MKKGDYYLTKSNNVIKLFKVTSCNNKNVYFIVLDSTLKNNEAYDYGYKKGERGCLPKWHIYNDYVRISEDVVMALSV